MVSKLKGKGLDFGMVWTLPAHPVRFSPHFLVILRVGHSKTQQTAIFVPDPTLPATVKPNKELVLTLEIVILTPFFRDFRGFRGFSCPDPVFVVFGPRFWTVPPVI